MLSWDDFSGGLWIPDQADTLVEQAGFTVPPNALLQADNVDYLPSGAVRGRRGSTRYNSAVLPGPVQMLRRYYGRPVPTSRQSQKVTGSTSDAVGTAEWSGAAGIGAVFDQTQAQATVAAAAQTQYLVGFAPFADAPIPANAIVTGIQARIIVEAGASTYLPTEASIILFRDFAPVGADQSTGAALTTSPAQYAYGGSGDLWGTTWSAADINSQGFGVGFSYLGTGINAIRAYYVDFTIYFSASEADTFLAAHTVGATLQYSRGTGGTFTAVSGGTLANPSRRPWAVAWPQKGKVFLFDGVNPVSEFNGVNIATTDSAQSTQGDIYEYLPPRKGPYACLHKNRLYATDPGELAYSVYGSEVNDETRWRPDVQLSVNDEKGGQITGLASFGDALLIFKSTCIYRFLGDPVYGSRQLSRYSEIGCVAPDSIQVTPFGVIFVGREGVWLTDGENVTLLSRAIRPLFVGRTDETLYANAVGVYYPRREQYWLSLTPGSGDGYVLHRINILTAEGEATTLAWSRIPSLPMNCGTVWGGSSDDGELYLGDTGGQVWLRDTGSLDDGQGYVSTVMTGQRYLNERRLEGRINRIKPLYRGSTALLTYLRYDQAGTDDVSLTIGEAGSTYEIREPRAYVSDQTYFGRFASIRILASEGPQFELHRLDCDVRVKGGRAWR